MTRSKLRASVVAERREWIDEMLAGIRALPLESHDEFVADPRNFASAESYLRRALEALLDFGRHVLAKGFGRAAPEYKAIASGLRECGVLSESESDLLRILAGYRNRMVHFYDELSREELYDICSSQLGDLEEVRDAIMRWIHDNPERIDRAL